MSRLAKKATSIFLAGVILATGIMASLPVSAASGRLNGKTALFVGDSIMAGWMDSYSNAWGGLTKTVYQNGGGWAVRIASEYGMTINNAATAGWTLSDIRLPNRGSVSTQLINNRNGDYDYVIIEGGFNDVMGVDGNTGSVTAALLDDKDSLAGRTYDGSYVYSATEFADPSMYTAGQTTFSGGLERAFYYATTYYPTARIGFLITPQTPFSTRGDLTWDHDKFGRYFNRAKEICGKWGIEYLDMFDGDVPDGSKSFYDVFYTAAEQSRAAALTSQCTSSAPGLTYIADDIHPNAAGYTASYDYVAEWMRTLQPYSGAPSYSSFVSYQGYNSYSAGNYSENYGASNTAGVGGNSAGRNVITGHSYDPANGQDDTSGNGAAICMLVNNSGNIMPQTAIVDEDKNFVAFHAGETVNVTFWAYWNPDEDCLSKFGFTNKIAAADSLDMTFEGITSRTAFADQTSMLHEASATVKMAKQTWTKVTLTVPVKNVSADTVYMNIGATFAGASSTNLTYVYIDEVTVEKAGLKIAGAAPVLQDDLAMNLLVRKSLVSSMGLTDLYAEVTMNDNVETLTPYKEDTDFYYFRFKDISPDRIGDTFTVVPGGKIGDKSFDGVPFNYSVAQYCYSKLAGKNPEVLDDDDSSTGHDDGVVDMEEAALVDDNTPLRVLLVNLLNYGAASQVYNDYKVDDLANADLTEKELTHYVAPDPALTSVLSRKYETVEEPIAVWRGASLHLKETVRMQFLLEVEPTDGLTVEIRDDNGVLKTVDSGELIRNAGYYIVHFEGYNASQMSKNIYLTAKVNGVAVSNTLRYSIESYASSVLSKDSDANLADLVLKMMKYGNAAKEYVAFIAQGR